MPHIHTKPGEHDHTVSAYIIKVDSGDSKILLHRHKLIKKFMQFGGHVEIRENPWQAITHELLEETGYDLSQLKILQPKTRIESLEDVTQHPIPVSYLTHGFDETDHYHTDIAFAFVTSQQPKHSVGINESSDIKAFDLKELKQIQPIDIYENVRRICIFVLTDILNNWEQLETTSFN